MSYTYQEQKNIIGRARIGIGKLGAKIVLGLTNGEEMKCQQKTLNYAFQVIDTLCRFAPIGTVVASWYTVADGDNTITQDQADALLNNLRDLTKKLCKLPYNDSRRG